MKSYLRFLGRNKLYTAIEVVGMSVALAFIIVLGSYILDDIKCYTHIDDHEEIYILRNRQILNEFYVRHDLEIDNIKHVPGIKDMCQCYQRDANFSGRVYTVEYQGKEYVIDPVFATDKNIFSFFNLPLALGDSGNILNNSNGAIISSSLATKIFGNENPIGKTILINFIFDRKDEFIIEGIFDEFPSCTIPQQEIIIRIDTFMSIPNRKGALAQDPRVQFVRIDKNADLAVVGEALQMEYSKMAPREGFYDIELVSIKDYHCQEGYASKDRMNFLNFRDAGTFRIYLYICIMLAVLSMLNYVLLTVAYSNFRIKEIATRQLLGTERIGIVLRCTLEALFLLLVSLMVAILLVFSCKDMFSTLLGVDLNPLTSLSEYVVLIIIVVLMAVPAGLSSAVAFSKHKPIDVIKGQKRKEEKMVLSRLFIGIEGCLAIASTAILLAVTLQLRHMLNYPLGYETDNIVYIKFNKVIPKHIDEIRALAFVDAVGQVDDIPMYRYRVEFPKGGNGHIGLMIGDKTAIDMMGISLNDYGPSIHTDPKELIPIIDHLYLSDETIDRLNDAVENREWLYTEWDQRRQIVGTCSHFRVGNIKQAYNGLCGVILLTDWQTISGQHDLLVKVNIDEDDASRMLLDEYKKLGYDERCVTVKSLNHYLDDALKDERVLQKLLLVFMFACLLLTAMAIAAFSSYYAHLRIHDTAVRKVFGESHMEIFCRTIWGFVLPILISAVIAVPLAYFAVSKWLETFAMRIDNSFIIYASAVLFVILIVLASIIIQTISLMRTNPAEALKKE